MRARHGVLLREPENGVGICPAKGEAASPAKRLEHLKGWWHDFNPNSVAGQYRNVIGLHVIISHGGS